MILKVKKNTKIIRRKSGTKSNMYFNENTAKAIETYQSLTDATEKEKLYIAQILPAFDKLVENLIYIHGFKGMHDSYDDLKNDCVTFLYEAIHKFDPSRGSKPFSYFNVVAKHWLIIRSKQRANKAKRNISIDDETIAASDRDVIENKHVIPAQDNQLETVEFVMRIHTLLDKIKRYSLSENESKCINAIIQIFKCVEDTRARPGEDLLLNKRAVFFLMREISGLSAKQLTTSIASLKKHYKELKNAELN